MRQHLDPSWPTSCRIGGHLRPSQNAWLGKPEFRESPVLIVATSRCCLLLLFLTILKIGHANPVRKRSFHKTQRRGWNNQDSFMPSICPFASLSTFVRPSAYPPTALPTTFAARGAATHRSQCLAPCSDLPCPSPAHLSSDLVQALRENPALLEAIGAV